MKKHLLWLFFSAFLAGALLLSCGTSQTAAEKEQKALRIKEKVVSFDFTFTAMTANPMNFGPVHLTSSYDLKVSKDTIQAYLPYFGRAYVANMDPTEGGIKFTSTDFDYNIVKGKRKGNWNITIKTLDRNPNLSLYLDIWESGSAQLIVSDPNRQTISFEGNIVDNNN